MGRGGSWPADHVRGRLCGGSAAGGGAPVAGRPGEGAQELPREMVQPGNVLTRLEIGHGDLAKRQGDGGGGGGARDGERGSLECWERQRCSKLSSVAAMAAAAASVPARAHAAARKG
jgi:hypothetical protein